MIKREDYLKAIFRNDNSVTHRQYYGQFVTEELKSMVSNNIGLSKIMASIDEQFSNIPITKWESLSRLLPFSVRQQMNQAGDVQTIASGICVFKEAALQIKEELW